MKVILMIADKELMIVDVEEGQFTYRVAFGHDLAKELLETHGQTVLPNWLEFTHQGKYRLCECGCTQMPILELTDARG